MRNRTPAATMIAAAMMLAALVAFVSEEAVTQAAGGRAAVEPGVGRVIAAAPPNGYLVPEGYGETVTGLRWPGPKGTEFIGSAGFFLRFREEGGPFRILSPAMFEGVGTGPDGRTLHEGCEGGRRYPHGECDDDGDGRIDEDPPDGSDNDGDGLIDEDFAAIGEEMRVTKAAEPVSGLTLAQSSYAWSFGHVRDFLGMTTTITYPDAGDGERPALFELEAALVVDFNIGSPGESGRGRDDIFSFVRLEALGTGDGDAPGFVSARDAGEGAPHAAAVVLDVEVSGTRTVGATGYITDAALEIDSLWSGPGRIGGPEGERGRIDLLPGRVDKQDTGAGKRSRSVEDEFLVFGEREGDLVSMNRLGTVRRFGPGDYITVHWALVFGRSEEILVRNVVRAIETYRGVPDGVGRMQRWIVRARKAARRELDVRLATVWAQGRRLPAVAILLPPDLEAEEVEWLKIGDAGAVEYERAGSKILVTIEQEYIDTGGSLSIAGQLTDGTIFSVELERELLLQCGAGDALPPGCLPKSSVQLYPNPFLTTLNVGINIYEPATYVSIDAAGGTGGMSSVRIYDVRGRLVRTILEEEFLHPGQYSLTWNGLEGNGAEVAPGVYYCKLQVGSRSLTKRVILLR